MTENIENNKPNFVEIKNKRDISTLPKNWDKEMLRLSSEGYFETELRVHVLENLSPRIWHQWLKQEDEDSKYFQKIVEQCKQLKSAYYYAAGRKGLFSKDFKDRHYNRIMININEWKFEAPINLTVSENSSLDIDKRIEELTKEIKNNE